MMDGCVCGRRPFFGGGLSAPQISLRKRLRIFLVSHESNFLRVSVAQEQLQRRRMCVVFSRGCFHRHNWMLRSKSTRRRADSLSARELYFTVIFIFSNIKGFAMTDLADRFHVAEASAESRTRDREYRFVVSFGRNNFACCEKASLLIMW